MGSLCWRMFFAVLFWRVALTLLFFCFATRSIQSIKMDKLKKRSLTRREEKRVQTNHQEASTLTTLACFFSGFLSADIGTMRTIVASFTVNENGSPAETVVGYSTSCFSFCLVGCVCVFVSGAAQNRPYSKCHAKQTAQTPRRTNTLTRST